MQQTELYQYPGWSFGRTPERYDISQTLSYTRPLQWGHNERDGVSNHMRPDCWLPINAGAFQRKHQLDFVRGIHRWLPTQKASNEENISIWWRRHAMYPDASSSIKS